MKMTPQQILDGFMKIKNRYIMQFAKKYSIKIPQYYTKKDSSDVLRIRTEHAIEIMKSLIPSYRLSDRNCVFCILNDDIYQLKDCSTCPYGLRHGICRHVLPRNHISIFSIIDSKILKHRRFNFYKFSELQAKYLIKYLSEYLNITK